MTDKHLAGFYSHSWNKCKLGMLQKKKTDSFRSMDKMFSLNGSSTKQTQEWSFYAKNKYRADSLA